ncbi:MAG: GldG family protein [Planctomycetota bacterium]
MTHANSQRGYGLTILFRVVLLLAVLAQLVFLGNRYKVRRDLTQDKLYSLSASTRKVLSGLADRLLIECYFTRDDKLPQSLQGYRRELKSVLDEYVRRSDGKVALQYFDPQSDQLLREKAERLQIKPEAVESVEVGELRQQQIWQGMRLRYGGDRQQVIPTLAFVPSTFQYEAQLTPLIKDLATKDKPKVKILAGVSPSGSRANPKGFQHLRSLLQRFDFSDLDLRDGKLVPDDVPIVLLMRPRELRDRDKYALDQFLMRGGKLVVFADTDDVEVGTQENRAFYCTKVEYDATGSELKFLDQLANYGAKVDERMVADCFISPVGNVQTGAQELMMWVKQTLQGAQGVPVFYPYILHALAVDWGTEDVARQLVQHESQGREIDPARVAQYQAAFKPGLDSKHPLALGQVLGPGMFWPCPVDLVDGLPSGVTGHVIARSSPLTVVAKPPREVNPFGVNSGDPATVGVALAQFQNTVQARLMAEPRTQVGLIVALQGAFPSAFAGRPLPPRKPPVKKDVDPLSEKVGKEGEDEAPKADAPKGEEGKTDESQDPEPIGPPIAGEEGQEGDKDADPPFLDKAGPGAQLVVVGDSDFLRDDFLSGMYGQMGRARVVGPTSDQRAAFFFAALLDWLIQDADLVALRTKVGTDRTIRLGQQEVLNGESLEGFTQRISRKESYLLWANVGIPAAALLVAWLLVSLVRAQRKAAFLGRVGS